MRREGVPGSRASAQVGLQRKPSTREAATMGAPATCNVGENIQCLVALNASLSSGGESAAITGGYERCFLDQLQPLLRLR